MTKEEILKLITGCRAMVITIAEDYLTADDMRLEMQAAFDNLVDDLSEDILPEEIPKQTIIDRLTDLYNDGEVKADEILTLLDTGEIIDYLDDEKFISLQIESLADREKLRDFLETEIFTSYNLQRDSINF